MNNTVNREQKILFDAFDRLNTICEIENISRERLNDKFIDYLQGHINEDVIKCLTSWLLLVIKNYECGIIDKLWIVDFESEIKLKRIKRLGKVS